MILQLLLLVLLSITLMFSIMNFVMLHNGRNPDVVRVKRATFEVDGHQLRCLTTVDRYVKAIDVPMALIAPDRVIRGKLVRGHASHTFAVEFDISGLEGMVDIILERSALFQSSEDIALSLDSHSINKWCYKIV